jgi:hypothetical protein
MELLSVNVDHHARRVVPASTEARRDDLIQRAARGDHERQDRADDDEGHIH